MKLNIKHFLAAALPVIFCLLADPASAQLNPFGAMYFQNQYMVNPAMAGLSEGLVVNLGYRQQWSSVQGAPTIQSLNAEYGAGGKVAFGLNLNNDKAGLLGRTRVMGTYAYHLPLSGDGQKLSFGLSLGFMDQRVESSDVVGDDGDVAVGRYNDRDTYFDADFGMAYTTGRLTVQGAVPNLKNFFRKDDVSLGADRSTFMAAASYKLLNDPNAAFTVEPKAVFRGVDGYKNIFDAGANLTFAKNSLNLLGMYHSTKSATLGFGMNYRGKFSVLGVYTTETSALRSYVNGNFEIAVRFNLLKQQK
ncbi:PorP/SprF family type IX secretion system membrane protein [Hufsiella ginkgonis]|uniref:Type IX secretion system membrane protein PorP/SprF n=1 Tax=Hufsiella ginkgonis TaxID=2695274 RepID=A0A7K1Y1E0_9SPHI|nr:type IX secretion system membrane protein PorP/SprF [Hufsiella ginkgonis]MXV17063.1 type IX secretion system membrane protein PorP/SprF [Hufsiella ginkgonis]